MKQRDTAFPFCSGNEVLTAVSDLLRWDTDCCWSVVAHTWTCFARAELDLFASKANAHCPLFFCHARLFGREGHPWGHSQLYVCLWKPFRRCWRGCANRGSP